MIDLKGGGKQTQTENVDYTESTSESQKPHDSEVNKHDDYLLLPTQLPPEVPPPTQLPPEVPPPTQLPPDAGVNDATVSSNEKCVSGEFAGYDVIQDTSEYADTPKTDPNMDFCMDCVTGRVVQDCSRPTLIDTASKYAEVPKTDRNTADRVGTFSL